MQMTSGLLTLLHHRPGWLSVPLLLAVAVTAALAIGLVLLVAADLLPAAAEPVRVAPLRWASTAG